MDLDLKDKVVFIAGSSRGIGWAIARAFLLEGARVVVTGREKDSLKSAVSILEKEFKKNHILSFAGDLSRPEQIASALALAHKRWDAIDHLIVNIGSGTARAGWRINQSDWDPVLETNLHSALRLTEATLPDMVRRKKGSIVFIASIAGVESIGAPISYSVAKAGLISFCKCVARQVGEHGVRVNSIAPGNILFPGGSWEKKIAKDAQSVDLFIQKEVPLRRFGKPEEIADMAVFLASDRAAFVTGTCVVVDGGQTRGF